MFRNQLKNIISGLSQKSDGQMMLVHAPEALENRKKFFTRLGLDSLDTVIAALVHGNTVQAVGSIDKSRIIKHTDALITNEKHVILTVTAADCLPIYFYNADQTAVGLAHAGWRGVEANIVANVVTAFRETFGVEAKDIGVSIGPHIRACHFSVLEDVALQFGKYVEFIERKGKVSYIDLAGIVCKQLVDAGVRNEAITVSPECTFEEPEQYFSYRRDKPAQVHAQVAYIGIL